MTTDWTPTEATAEPNKLVDADELSRAVAHVKEWFAAELAKLRTPAPMENTGTVEALPMHEDSPMRGTMVEVGDEIHQTGTSDV